MGQRAGSKPLYCVQCNAIKPRKTFLWPIGPNQVSCKDIPKADRPSL